MPVYDSHLRRYEDLMVGQRIREKRQDRGLTLRNLSEQVKISVARLSEIENDRHVPNVAQSSAIAAAPGLSPEHDIFIQQMKLKNTLRWMKGQNLITHLGLDYYD